MDENSSIKTDNKIFNENEQKIFEKSFDRLVNLQALLKKESSLKELCKTFIIILNYLIFIVIKTREDTSKALQEICNEIYTQKLEFNNMIAEKIGNDNRKYKLVSDIECFGLNKIFIGKLFKILWDDPKIVSILLINSNIEEVKNNLAPFFVNNFYENILSSVYTGENLMYVISMLLIEEIKGLRKENYNKFLEETVSGYILEQLKNKFDIKNYFKVIIYNLLEKLEAISSNKQINLKVKQIQEELNQARELQKKIQKSGLKQKIVEKIFYNKNANLAEIFYDNLNENRKDNIQKDLFNFKYIADVTKEVLQKKIKENEGKKGMEEFCNLQIKNLENNSNIFSHEKFLANILLIEDSNDALSLYQIDFFKVITIIDELFNNLLENINLIPYSVKCICKIILSLVKKGNPNINTIEQNILLSKFFFYKLFLPIFRNPAYEALINNFIISDTTIHNLDIISKVIEKLISGSFINNDDDNCDYTPFNFYFLEKMPMVLKFFENITKVTLQPFIDKLINGNLPNDFIFNYFKENPEEVVFHRSTCFNVDDLLVLLSNIKKCENNLFIKENSYIIKISNKLNKEEIFNSLGKSEQYEIINNETQKKEEKKIINYYLFTDLLVNEKYKKLFFLKQERSNFYIKELKKIQNEKDKQENNIIRAKNCLSGILFNYHSLIKTHFEEGATKNTIKILKELKKFKKISNFDIDETFPFEWYINSLIDIFNYLPTDLQLNDFENLFNSLEIDVINSIKDINFEIMSIYSGKVKFSKRIKIYYENAIKSIKDLELNKKVKFIIQKEPISSIISLRYTEKEKKFKIEKGKTIKEISVFEIYKDDNENKKICPTIESFVHKFPDISKIQSFEDVDLFELENELKLPNELSKYFEIVKEYLYKKLNIDSNSQEFEYINNKIFDYVFESIYNKIYPQKPNEKDNNIYKKCKLLSKVEPQDLIEGNNNNLIFDSFLRDIFGYFQKIEKEKSPRKKLFNILQIFASIRNTFKFSRNNEKIGLDDITPILSYTFIKAHPLYIYTNCNFTKLFLNLKEVDNYHLNELESICSIVENFELQSS